MTVRRIHRWPIVTALGAGGMGRVYEVRDRAGVRWALKTLPHTWEPADAARLRREADLMARVDHPNVARVARGVLNHDPPYLLTELLTGPTLHERVSDSDVLEPVDVIDIARGVARGLVALHDLGIVHRDLTPRNVILNERGPCIIDFGVAYAADVTQLTQIDATPGTPAWMAPERAGGLAATAAADVYGWGRLVAYAATGRVDPDAAELDETSLGRQLIDLTRRALSHDPLVRPTTVELAAWAGPAEQPLPPLANPRTPRHPRHFVLAGAGVTVTLMLTVGAWGLLGDGVTSVRTSAVEPTGTGSAAIPPALVALAEQDVPTPAGAAVTATALSTNFADGTSYRLIVPGTRTSVADWMTAELTVVGWAGSVSEYASPSVTRPDGTPETSSDGVFEHGDGRRLLVFVSDDTTAGQVVVSIEVSGPPSASR